MQSRLKILYNTRYKEAPQRLLSLNFNHRKKSFRCILSENRAMVKQRQANFSSSSSSLIINKYQYKLYSQHLLIQNKAVLLSKYYHCRWNLTCMQDFWGTARIYQSERTSENYLVSVRFSKYLMESFTVKLSILMHEICTRRKNRLPGLLTVPKYFRTIQTPVFLELLISSSLSPL
jgi:hypothetical protein